MFIGAQRLSASQIHSPECPCLECRPGWKVCSTPFGISDPFTGKDALRAISIQLVCSTPFGIGDRGTRDHTAATIHAARQCSTPFGIRDRGTRVHRRWGIASKHSAQRLSASEIHAPNIRWWLAYRLHVLNAFRHLRSMHLDVRGITLRSL